MATPGLFNRCSCGCSTNSFVINLFLLVFEMLSPKVITAKKLTFLQIFSPVNILGD